MRSKPYIRARDDDTENDDAMQEWFQRPGPSGLTPAEEAQQAAAFEAWADRAGDAVLKPWENSET